MFFARQIRGLEHAFRVLGNPQQRDALVEIGQISVHHQLELTRDLPLLIPIVRTECIEERVVHFAVDIVDVQLLHPLAQIVLLTPEPVDSTRMFLLDEMKILLERPPQPLEHLRRHRDLLNHRRELLEERLFAHIWLATVALRVTASVIDIFLLFNVADQKAAAVATVDEASEDKILLHALHPGRVARIHDDLNLFPELA